jgi:signal transduction histidine kinase
VELTESWKYRWGESPLNEGGIPIWFTEENLDEEWKPIAYRKSIFNPPGRNGERELWLCVSLPDTNWERPSVAVDNVSLPCDVYLEGELIYRHEAVSLLGETKNRLPISHMIPLETEYQNRKLFFRMYPDDSSIMGIEGVLCGSQHELTRKMVKENIHLIILGSLFLATGIISILIFIKRRQEKIHLAFGLFSLCLGIMAIYEARELRQLFFDRSSLADAIFILVPFFMPGWLCMYFESIFGSGYKSIIRRLWQIHLIYAILCLSVLILNFVPFSAMQMHYILYLMALTTMLVLFSTSVFYAIKGKPEARIITIGFAAFFIFGIYDILGGGLLIIPSWSRVAYPWGMLVFIFTLGFVIERRFSEAHRKLGEYSLTLEQKVEERTQELSEKNKELEQTLQKLNETQSQMVMQSKMASLGDLVAGVAHEMNNPVGVIHSTADNANRGLNKLRDLFQKVSEWVRLLGLGDHRIEEFSHSEDQIQQSFDLLGRNQEVITIASDRVANIVGSLRSFARLDEALFQQVDIHKNLDTTLTLMQHELRDKVTVIKRYGEIPQIQCYPNELNQVFMNLLQNAAQAVEQKGTITVSTYTDDTCVFIKISDTGKGIPSEDLTKIYDPGFTTRSGGVGKGLGLSIVYNIIHKHHGNIEVNSEVDKGTEVVIALPIEHEL